MADQHEDETELAEQRFDRRMRIITGIVSVIGVAATTVMTIMEAEKSVHDRKRAKVREVKTTKGSKKKKGPKLLKAPPKQKRLKASLEHQARIEDKQLATLQTVVQRTLVKAKKLQEQAEKAK